MSGIFGALANSAQSLGTQSMGVQIAGKNIANVNNSAYARQRILLTEGVTVDTVGGPQSMGVSGEIVQIRDKFLDSQITREISQSSYLEAQSQSLQTAQTNLGEVIDSTKSASTIGDTSATGNGLSAAITNFFNKFSALSSNPTDPGTKQALLGQADTLVSQFNSIDQRLAGLQSDIDTQINGDVSVVNGLLSDIANLNAQVQKFELVTPNAAVDSRDQRQAKLEELSKYMNFTATEIPGQNGQVEIVSGGVTLVSKAAVTGQMSFDSTTSQFSWGVPATPLNLQAGSMQGDVVVRNGAIQDIRDSLKATAQQLVTSVNQAYNPSGTGGNFFVPFNPAAPVLSVALDPTLNYSTLKATATANAGANETAMAVAAVAKQVYSVAGGDAIDGTIGGYYNASVTNLAQNTANAASRLDDQQTVEDMVRIQRDAVSAVSQDEEMTDLMKYQRGFQAVSKVINVLDSLLDTVINGMIR